jgi:hypothetical protein
VPSYAATAIGVCALAPHFSTAKAVSRRSRAAADADAASAFASRAAKCRL